MTEEIMRSLGRLEQSAQDTRQDLQEIKRSVVTVQSRLGKVETGQARLKALAGIVTTAIAGGAGWTWLK